MVDVKRFVTENTVWLFDETGRFCRLPRFEGQHRDQYKYSQRLDDNVWQEHTHVSIQERDDKLHAEVHTPAIYDQYGLVSSPLIEGESDLKWLAEYYSKDKMSL